MSDTSTTILIIDDNLFFVEKLRRSAEAAGYQVDTAMFPGGAERAMTARRPKTIIVNLDSDRMQPIAEIRRIRAHPEFRNAVVIGFCGHVHANRLEEGAQAGATVVVSNGEIANRLADVLREHAAP